MQELDNLDEIEQQGSSNTDLVLSNVYTVRIGGFGLRPNIKTYLTTLDVTELEQDVEFYEKLSSNKDWPISQIIQREVDQSRVNSIAKKYVLGTGRLVKYFPPIIIALIPRDREGNFLNTFDYTVDQSQNSKEAIYDKSKYRDNQRLREIFLSKVNESLIGGVFLFNDSQVFEHNIFCWDKNKIYAVVIDGQHRLDALIKGRQVEAGLAVAKQDVVFIDASPLIPTSTAESPSPIQILRTVFIDINTNAKSVGLVRRVLMDDKDLASLCVQSLIESVNSDGTSKIEGSFIPSILIDWYGESLKHELPYISGVLTLYQIISDELVTDRLLSIDDHRSQQKLRKFIDLLNQYFFVDQKIRTVGDFSDIIPLERSFQSYLHEKETTIEAFSEEIYQDELDSIIFDYDYRTLEVAQKTFEEYYAQPIINILLKFTPYYKAIQMLNDLQAFDSNSSIYKTLLLPKRKIIKNTTLREIFTDARQQINSALYPNYYLLFSVVGQKAVFKFFFERLFEEFDHGITPGTIVGIQEACTEELNSTLGFLQNLDFKIFGSQSFDISDFIANDLLEFGTIASEFWEGILYEDGKIVYNTQGVKAFCDVLKFIIDVVKFAKKEIDNLEVSDYSFRFSALRTKRQLRKRFGNRTDPEFDSIADRIINQKKEALITRVMQQQH